MRHYLLGFVCILSSIFSFGQAELNTVDSLIQALQDSNHGALENATICLELVDLYANNNTDSAFYFNQKAEKFIKHVRENSKIAAKKWKGKQATVFVNYGMISYFEGNMVGALNYNNQALNLWRSINDNLGLGLGYNNIAVIYKNAGEFKEAENYYFKSLKSIERAGDPSKVAMTNNNLANLYKETGEYDKALKYASVARDLRLEPFDIDGYASVLNNIGVIYTKLEKLDSAEMVFLEALELVKQSENIRGRSFVEMHLAELYLVKGDLEKSKQFGESALVLGQKFKSQSNIMTSSKVLSEIYARLKNWEKAYEMQLLSETTQDQLNISELNKDLIKSELKFEFDKQHLLFEKETEKKLVLAEKQQEKQNIITFSAVLITFLLIVFSFLLYKRHLRLKKQKVLIQEQSEERKILLQEIHHRVKNNFQVISSMLKLQSGSLTNDEAVNALEDAVNRIYAMSGVHELIYMNETFAKMEHSKYMKKLIENIQNLYGDKTVQIQIDVTSELASVKLAVALSIILNELITNSYKHAFKDGHPNPSIEISLEQQQSGYLLTYKDNGLGIHTIPHDDNFGTVLIHSMVEQLEGELKISENEEWKTIVEVRFPGDV